MTDRQSVFQSHGKAKNTPILDYLSALSGIFSATPSPTPRDFALDKSIPFISLIPLSPSSIIALRLVCLARSRGENRPRAVSSCVRLFLPPRDTVMESTTSSHSREAPIMSVWPSIATFGVGRMLGRAYNLGPRLSIFGIPARPGWLVVLATLPVAVLLYAVKIAPRLLVIAGPSNPYCRRYRLTTERVVVDHPFDARSRLRAKQAIHHSLNHTDYDTIECQAHSGYEWYRAADLVFRRDDVEVLRLVAVPHAESFRQTCLKTRQALLGVRKNVDPAASPIPVVQVEA